MVRASCLFCDVYFFCVESSLEISQKMSFFLSHVGARMRVCVCVFLHSRVQAVLLACLCPRNSSS